MPTRFVPAASPRKAPPAVVGAGSAVAPKSQPQKALEKLGLRRDIDLALHLPLRYEDETRIIRLADARDGDMVQIEAQVVWGHACGCVAKSAVALSAVKWCTPVSAPPAASLRPR